MSIAPGIAFFLISIFLPRYGQFASWIRDALPGNGIFQTAYEDVPEWAFSLWFYVIFCLAVLSILLVGAYGLHVFMRRRLRHRRAMQEQLVDTHTENIANKAAVFEEANAELAWTNDALISTNQSLHQSNENLSWTNTQLSDANIALERRSAELRIALENNETILGITAHDLKNPLGGIIGLSNMLLEDVNAVANAELNAESVENIQMIRDTAEEMLHCVQDLLDRHRQGLPARLHQERVDIHIIISIVLKWNSQQARTKSIVVEYTPYPDALLVFVDVSAMQRVIDNLVSNAIKYSPSDTTIYVDVEPLNKEVLIKVRDEGPGLTEEDLSKVFGKMQRLSATPTGGEHSTGLGLFIVKKIVEEHGGAVGVDSEYGEGAVFWVRLPQG